MLKNNLELDVKVKCIEKGMTQAGLARKSGITPSYVNRLIRKSGTVVNRSFLLLMETLGYDIELHYVKKEAE